MDIITTKYCKRCKYYYYKNNNNICYCGNRCVNYNINYVIYSKLLLKTEHTLIYLILNIYNLNSLDNNNFYLVIKNILETVYRRACTTNSDLLFIIANALILKNKRIKKHKYKYNYNYNYNYICNIYNKLANFKNAIFLLSLDFYFATIYISDYNFSLNEWNKLIYIPSFNNKTIRYNLYRDYLKKIDYNIYIPNQLLFQEFELIINYY